MTEASDTMRSRRIVVVSSRLWRGYNDLWDAVEPEVGALAVVGATAKRKDAEIDPPGTRTAFRSVDFGRGLVWEHLFGLRRFLREFRPDLVHVNRELWTVVAQEALSCDAAVVVHGAENLWHHGGHVERAVRDRLVTRAVRRVDGYASWNHAGADHVTGLRTHLGLEPIPTLALPAVVPPAEYRDVRWSPPDDGTLRVLLVGRATHEKGFQDVIAAAAKVPRAQVILCGEGKLLDELTRDARARGVSFDALGFVTADEVAEEMARAHVLVQPSLTTTQWAEQFGRTVAEAMTVGLPCLVSDSGELPFLVGHDSRAVFREGDVDDLCRRLTSLTDPGARQTLSTHQLSLAEAWRPEQAGAEVLGLWRRVLA